LVVEDDPAMGALLVKDLGRRGFVVDHVTSALDALALLQRSTFTTVVSDIHLGGMTGLELCTEVGKIRPFLPFILITGFGDLESAIAALRAGAHDFLPKPFEIDALAARISRTSEHYFLRAELNRLRELPPDLGGFEGMTGRSPVMQQVFSQIERIAAGSSPILIVGETGTGKELAARAIRARSPRRQLPFAVINCSTVSDDEFEVWLQGGALAPKHEMRVQRPGPFAENLGGTVLLDEIDALSPRGQALLLRAIQERAFHPIASDRPIPFDLRLIASSRRELIPATEKGEFREDLYFRMSAVQLDLPPLRARGFDILALASEFLRRIALSSGRPIKGLSPESAQALLNYAWPGNVLELRNTLEQAYAISEHDEITLGDIPERFRGGSSGQKANGAAKPGQEPVRELVALDEIEKRYILKVIDAVGGNRTRAAEILRVDRKTLYTKLKTYGWRPPEGAS
jgi:two-component system response regulator HydG